MTGARQAFDPDARCIVACQELVVGPARLQRGDALDWRALGLGLDGAWQLWIALKIDCLPAAGEEDSNPGGSCPPEPGATPGSATITDEPSAAEPAAHPQRRPRTRR